MPRTTPVRARILAAATREFAARGYAGARVRTIATVARANVALLYYHFGNKPALYAAVLDAAVLPIATQVAEQLRAPVPPDDAITAVIATHARLVGENPALRQFLLREMLDAGGKQMAPALARLVQGPLGQLVGVIATGQSQGRFRADLDPRLTAISLVAPNVYYHIAAPVVAQLLGRSGGPPTPAELDAFIAHTTRFALAALAPIPR